MNHDQPKPDTGSRRLDAAVDEYPARLRLSEKFDAPNFIQHLLSIPRGGPSDLLDSPSLTLRDEA